MSYVITTIISLKQFNTTDFHQFNRHIVSMLHHPWLPVAPVLATWFTWTSCTWRATTWWRRWWMWPEAAMMKSRGCRGGGDVEMTKNRSSETEQFMNQLIWLPSTWRPYMQTWRLTKIDWHIISYIDTVPLNDMGVTYIYKTIGVPSHGQFLTRDNVQVMALKDQHHDHKTQRNTNQSTKPHDLNHSLWYISYHPGVPADCKDLVEVNKVCNCGGWNQPLAVQELL